MERNNTKLIVVSQHAMMTWGPILEQLFEQCHCSDRFSVCGFEEFLLHREYGNPYIIVPRVSSERRRYVPIGFTGS
mgnify:CR=1 FL=1